MDKAIKKLRSFFKDNGIRPTPWAVQNNIAPPVITRLFQGKNIAPVNALKIVKGTYGVVKLSDFYC